MSAPEDLLQLTAELIDIPSESYREGPLVEHLEAQLQMLDHLEVVRVGDNLVARTDLGLSRRLILAGHTDTVPAAGNATARLEGDTLWGLGAADMKGGLAVMLASARHHRRPSVDLTYVFYAREEVAAADSGLEELFVARPDLLTGDLALLGEPTDAAIEAGCQGTLRAKVELRGRRAHTARAWMGDNAIHRAAPLIAAVAAIEPRTPEIEGCRYHEAWQVVGISGGVSGNVVPDLVEITIGHRFAPDRTLAEAEAEVRSVLSSHLREGDSVEVVDGAPAAAPALEHPLLRQLIEVHQLEVRAKLGWTDVARFAWHGVPAANFGPGDATLAHTPEERIYRDSLERVWSALDAVVGIPW